MGGEGGERKRRKARADSEIGSKGRHGKREGESEGGRSGRGRKMGEERMYQTVNISFLKLNFKRNPWIFVRKYKFFSGVFRSRDFLKVRI